MLFSDQYLKYGHLATADSKVWIIGEVDLARGTPQVVVDRILPIEAPPRDPVSGLDLLIDGQRFNGESLDRMERAAEIVSGAVLAPTDAASAAWTGRPAPVRVFVRLETGGNAVPVRTGEGWSVRPTAHLLKNLLGALGEGSVRISGPLLPRDRDESRDKWASKTKVGASRAHE